jgi:esterase/lipase
MEALANSTDQQWLESVWQGYRRIVTITDRVAAVGLSTGAALLARLLVERDCASIVTLSMLAPFLGLRFPARCAMEVYGWFRKSKPKSSSRIQYYLDHGLKSHSAYPISALKCADRNGRVAWKALPAISRPTLIVGGAKDHHVKPSTVQRAGERVGAGCARAPRVEVMIAANSGHILTVEPDAEEVLRRVIDFNSRQ